MTRVSRVVVATLMILSLQTGTSYAAAADWMDHWTGPGPFWGVSARYRFLCISRASDQGPLPPGVSGSDIEQTYVRWLSPIAPSSGLLAVGAKGSESKASDRDTYRKETATYVCRNDGALSAYLRGGFRYLESMENNLFPANAEDPRYQVHVFEPNLQYLARVHRAFDVGLGAGVVFISGDAFNTFHRLSVEPIIVSFAPWALSKDDQHHRTVRIEFSLSAMFGGLKASDFCNGGRVSCEGLRAFSSKAEFVPALAFHIDPAIFRR